MNTKDIHSILDSYKFINYRTSTSLEGLEVEVFLNDVQYDMYLEKKSNIEYLLAKAEMNARLAMRGSIFTPHKLSISENGKTLFVKGSSLEILLLLKLLFA